MSNILVAVATHIRGVECDVEAQHLVDEQGNYTLITVTVADTGLPLFEDDVMVDGHIGQADLYRAADEYARHGHLLPRVTEPDADIIAFPATVTQSAGVAA